VDVRDVVVSKGGKTGVTAALVEGIERSFLTYRGENGFFTNLNPADTKAGRRAGGKPGPEIRKHIP
jgi:sugar/nucleoside kinase (ribokinase family)